MTLNLDSFSGRNRRDRNSGKAAVSTVE